MTRRHHLARAACALFGFLTWGVTPAFGADTVPKAPQPALETSFLKEEPWSKQKLSVDLSAITDPQHMQTVRGAINQIIIFIARVSAVPPMAANPASAFTEGALFRLRRPPKVVGIDREMRPFHKREYDWVVTNGTRIAVTVDFGIIRANPEYTDRFVFVLESGAWKFDRHDWDQPKFQEKK